MKKYKVGIIGNMSACYENKGRYGGQTIKTKILYEYLCENITDVQIADSNFIKKNPLFLFLQIRKIAKNCENIVFIVGENGFLILLPYIYILQRIYKMKCHEFVIGGRRQVVLEKYILFQLLDKRLYKVYVETKSMLACYQNLNFHNVEWIPNFKKLKILERPFDYDIQNIPLKICTFSRVAKDKGIEKIIKSVESVNEKLGKTGYSVDIYGEIEKDYKKQFDEMRESFPACISYKGIVFNDNIVDTLKNYYLLSFLTEHEGEGFPGTIIDAYSAGIPILASNFKYNTEIIKDGETGLILKENSLEEIQRILLEIYENRESILVMRRNALMEAKKYTVDSALKTFLTYL